MNFVYKKCIKFKKKKHFLFQFYNKKKIEKMKFKDLKVKASFFKMSSNKLSIHDLLIFYI